jgi:large subunit ribosomal protein L6
MSMTDPIADMLTRIRNACGSKHRRVDIPASKMKIEIARVLKENNLIQDYATVETEDGKPLLRVRLKYAGGQPVIRQLQRVSTPGLRRYVGAGEIPRVRNGLGMAILSTSRGIMSDAAVPHRRRTRRLRLVGDHAMSRIGKLPIDVPSGVAIAIDGRMVKVKGPKGELTRTFPAGVGIAQDGSTLTVSRESEETNHRALHGLSRTLLANMVEGVTKGYQKTLEITGVGYKAEVKPYGLQLSLGFSHTIEYKAPAGVKLTAPQPTVVVIEGPDKEKVGQVAAEIRSLRKPEPYKGKGVRYQGEAIRRKAGKAGGK